LKPNAAFFIRTFISNSRDDDTEIENLIPNLSFWVDLINAYTEKYTLQHDIYTEYVLSNLIGTSIYLNLSDEVGRKCLITTLSTIN
jgi:hypothetical protein